MWTVYKREIMQREKEQKDFLKKYYAHNKEQHEMQLQNGPMGKQGKGHVMPPRQESEDDWPVELDSDEEPMSFQAQKKNKEVSERKDFHEDTFLIPQTRFKETVMSGEIPRGNKKFV